MGQKTTSVRSGIFPVSLLFERLSSAVHSLHEHAFLHALRSHVFITRVNLLFFCNRNVNNNERENAADGRKDFQWLRRIFEIVKGADLRIK